MKILKNFLLDILTFFGIPYFKVINSVFCRHIDDQGSSPYYRIIVDARSEDLVRIFNGAFCIKTKFGLGDKEAVRSKKILSNMLSRLIGLPDETKQKILDKEVPCVFIFMTPEEFKEVPSFGHLSYDYARLAAACSTEGYYYDYGVNIDITSPETVQGYLNPFVFRKYKEDEDIVANRHASLERLNRYRPLRSAMLNFMVMIDEVIEMRN